MTLFYGITAPWTANVNLAVQIAMGLALVAGMMLARRKRFRAHQKALPNDRATAP